ncbi:hypothetical protein D9M69_481560 [compost metagenome]
MKEISIDAKTILLKVWTGEVLSSDKSYETRVTSSGGGGYVGQYGGHVAAPKISSHAIERHEIWIRDENGEEQSIQLSNANISLRPGQRISVILAARHRGADMHVAAIVNHSAKTSARVYSDENLANQLGLIPNRFAGPIGIVSFALFAIGFWFTGTTELILGGFAGMTYAAYHIFKALTKHPNIFAALGRAVRGAVQEAQAKASKEATPA